MPKNIRVNIHKQRLKAIRPFVNFNYPLNAELKPHEKRKIKKYYDEIARLRSRPHVIYRPRSRKAFIAGCEYAGQPPWPGFRAVFIPVMNPAQRPRVRISKKGEISIKTDFVSTKVLVFDPLKLVRDPEKHVKELIAKSGAKAFNVKVGDRGKFEIHQPRDDKTMPRYVNELMERYSNWGEWLYGLTAHTFSEQKTIHDYTAAKGRALEAFKSERSKQRKR